MILIVNLQIYIRLIVNLQKYIRDQQNNLQSIKTINKRLAKMEQNVK
jgi:hypothetical protein